MVTWEVALPDVIHIAEELVETIHQELRIARIGFVFRSEPQVNKGRTVIGKVTKVSDQMKPVLDLDFLIWIAKDEFQKMNDERRRALIDHELCHIAMGASGLTLRGHDVEEFHAIIERYGLWTHDLMTAKKAMERAEQLHMDNLTNGLIRALDAGEAKRVSVEVKSFG